MKPATRRLKLAWSATEAPAEHLLIAFASGDRAHVDQHFGAAEGFVLYSVGAERAHLSGVLDFAPSAMDGQEDKLAAKIAALAGCAAVYCLAVGASAVRQLLAEGIQPIKLDEALPIDSLLPALSAAIAEGGVPWIDKALRAADEDPERFDRMAEEGWSE